MNNTKYLEPPVDVVKIGPTTSEYINSSTLDVGVSPVVKGNLFSFSFKQMSHLETIWLTSVLFSVSALAPDCSATLVSNSFLMSQVAPFRPSVCGRVNVTEPLMLKFNFMQLGQFGELHFFHLV